MKRRDIVATMIGASLFLLAVLTVFAVELSNNQVKSKRDAGLRHRDGLERCPEPCPRP
jgi:hypothetical protein